jgi:hypothetical protein
MDASLEEFLAAYSQEVREISLKVRALIFEVEPEAVEQLDLPASLIAYGYGPKYADTLCTLMPQKTRVNLGIYRAVELPDSEGLLEGTGKLHRHVKLNSVADVSRPALRALLQAAVAMKKGAGATKGAASGE